MAYPGLTYIGNGKITGLYGLNETIHDQKSIGLQHLYINDYQMDYIYAATTVLKLEGVCYYGDRIKPKSGHPIKQGSSMSRCEDGFVFVDEFVYEKFNKTDQVFCPGDDHIVFQSCIENTSDYPIEVEMSALVITSNNTFTVQKNLDKVFISGNDNRLYIDTNEKNTICRISKDAPSGFMYHGIQDILFDENHMEEDSFKSNEPIAVSRSKILILHPGDSYTFMWSLGINNSEINYEHIKLDGKKYWDKWLNESNQIVEAKVKSNLIALKSINMNGFLPADLTGHYFASNQVSFYVRDALHGARAFLYSGHYKECKQIVDVVLGLSRRDNHEIFQRYNAKLLADEGANNNVFSQIDFIGYLLTVIADYYYLTGDLLTGVDDLMKEVMILEHIPKKNGLYGPEGGVNEGVYGPAFITSTNIFITGGLNCLMGILKKENKEDYRTYVIKLIKSIVEGINHTFLSEGYYAYGYVNYHDQLVKRYDTPQLFGASLGYPIDENYRKNFYKLSTIATYFDYGYGYSEQEYHDGPWLFNTAFAGQTAYILGDMKAYKSIMDWMDRHKNDYALLPEAIDARDEGRSFINPLMWANAEYISAVYVDVINKLRKGK